VDHHRVPQPAQRLGSCDEVETEETFHSLCISQRAGPQYRVGNNMKINWLSPAELEEIEKRQSESVGDFCFVSQSEQQIGSCDKPAEILPMRLICLSDYLRCAHPKERGQFCVGLCIASDEKSVRAVGPGRLVVVEVDPEVQKDFTRESVLMATPGGFVTNAEMGYWACGHASSSIINGKCAMLLGIFPVEPEK
jgi:hypothetical protein